MGEDNRPPNEPGKDNTETGFVIDFVKLFKENLYLALIAAVIAFLGIFGFRETHVDWKIYVGFVACMTFGIVVMIIDKRSNRKELKISNELKKRSDEEKAIIASELIKVRGSEEVEQPMGTICIPSKDNTVQIPVYTFYSLSKEPPFILSEQGDRTVTYQDFTGYSHPVQNMWAEPYGDYYIKTRREDKTKFIVAFKSHNHYHSNITIRPQHGKPFEVPPNKTHLVIQAKARKDDNGKPLAIGVRVVNGYYQHWANSPQKFLLSHELSNNEFTNIRISIMNKAAPWTFFQSDGNVFYDSITGQYATFEADTFKYIIGVTLEFGIHGERNLEPGEGEVEIERIYFE